MDDYYPDVDDVDGVPTAAEAARVTLADLAIVAVTPLAGLAVGFMYAFQYAQVALAGHARWVNERQKFAREVGAWVESLPTVDVETKAAG